MSSFTVKREFGYNQKWDTGGWCAFNLEWDGDEKNVRVMLTYDNNENKSSDDCGDTYIYLGCEFLVELKKFLKIVPDNLVGEP